MKTRFAPLLAVVFAAGCQSLQDVEVMELEGFWVASQARFVEIAAPKRNNLDILDLGFGVTMEFDAVGNFELTILPPDETGEQPEAVVGTMEIDGTKVVFVTGTGEGEVFRESEQMAIRLTAGLEFPFDERGPVPTRLLLVMDRTSGPQ
ncbi:MAG: hypothetical protein R3195_04305 [Gemmatimonadota bacterium]|nr:hypothetical protein [Gemmatimonadota bacterium]